MEKQMRAFQTPVSDDAIRQWLKEQKIRLRKIQKTKADVSVIPMPNRSCCSSIAGAATQRASSS